MADWRQETDILRCNPNFHNHSRYDCAIFNGSPCDFFGRLLFMFTCTVGNKQEPVALIQPYDPPSGGISEKDQDLGFYRLRERRTQQRTEFVSLKAVRRGALLVPDFEKAGDYLVHDLVDSDMFLRMRDIKASSV